MTNSQVNEAIRYQMQVLFEIYRLTNIKHKIECKAPEQRTWNEVYFLFYVDGTLKEYEKELTRLR